MTGRPRTDPVVRFSRLYSVDDESGCWLWTGHVSRSGYVQFVTGGSDRQYAHRWAYEHFVGPIPEGRQLDHLCRTRHCVNPAHLEPVTPRENTLRAVSPPSVNAAKTYCLNGHPFDEDNTLRVPQGRKCRTCRREIHKRYRMRKKESA